MPLVFNPFTGNFDYAPRRGGDYVATKRGQLLVSTDGVTFSARRAVVSDKFAVVCDDNYEPVVGDT